MSLAAALWTYQAERFPLKKVVPLLAVFSAASVTLSAVLGERPLPGWSAYATAFMLVLVVFFQMRVGDEAKDLEDDRRWRPERPIPRGLVSLHLIVGLGLAAGLVAVAAALAHGSGLVWLLGLVWLWLVAMTAEFGAPVWLKAHPVLYLASHMLIMPLIDLMLTGVEWQTYGSPPAGLWLFIGLSFANGCVLEIGRKVWAPEAEREGVDTYSKLWGPKRAVAVWLGMVSVALALLVGLGAATGTVWAMVPLGGAGLAGCVIAGRAYLASPEPSRAARIDAMAGGWVFLCYAAAGLLPWLIGGTA